MNIAFEGCFHGNLEQVYKTMSFIEQQQNIKIDALISCGDFQAIRNKPDMYSMKCPEKYLEIGNFHEYYTGAKKAPYLTIFIGGNHEASNHSRELHFGGWAAPNIYFLGQSNVISLRKGKHSIRIGGISGIFNPRDFIHGKFERFPLDNPAIVSCFHQKQLDVLMLSMLQQSVHTKLDVFLSHDWPSDVVQYGDVDDLLRRKKHFAADVNKGELGSFALNYIMRANKPKYWISGHMHVKYAAVFPHDEKKEERTMFLALDKCLPHRDFLQIIPFSSKSADEWEFGSTEKQEGSNNNNNNESEEEIEMFFDSEWLNITKSIFEIFHPHSRQDFFSLDSDNVIRLKNAEFVKRFRDQQKINESFFDDKELRVPKNFEITCKPYTGDPSDPDHAPDQVQLNNQTKYFLKLIGIDHERFRDILFYDNEKKSMYQPQHHQERQHNRYFNHFEVGQQQAPVIKQQNAVNQDEIDLNDDPDVQEQINRELIEKNKANQLNKDKQHNSQVQVQSSAQKPATSAQKSNQINIEELPFL